MMGEFILQVPQTWSVPALLSPAGTAFLIPAAAAVIAALACFLGFRFLLTVAFLGGVTAGGFLGLHLLRRFSAIDYVKVLVFLIAMGIAGCLMYALAALCSLLVHKCRLGKPARWSVCYAVPFLCAAVLFQILFRYVYTGVAADAAVSAAVFLLGLFVQKKTGVMARELHRFEDRYDLTKGG